VGAALRRGVGGAVAAALKVLAHVTREQTRRAPADARSVVWQRIVLTLMILVIARDIRVCRKLAQKCNKKMEPKTEPLFHNPCQ
jgi:hypothetical protein